MEVLVKKECLHCKGSEHLLDNTPCVYCAGTGKIERWISIEELKDAIYALPMAPFVPPQIPKDYVKNQCPECQMTFDGATGYVCSNPRCPMGLAGPQC